MTPHGSKMQWLGVARALVTALLLLCIAAPLHAAEKEARVLMLYGLDPYLPPFLAMDKAMRESLRIQCNAVMHCPAKLATGAPRRTVSLQ
jgi:hypothetical protein